MTAADAPRPASSRLRRAVVDHVPPAWVATIPVERWMRRPVVTIRVDARVREAVTLMRERGIRHLPVLDDADRLVGIVTDRDLRQVTFDVALGAASEDVERGDDFVMVGILTERDLLDVLQGLLRERVVRPSPAAGDPGGTYDPGMVPPPTRDPWHNTAAPE